VTVGASNVVVIETNSVTGFFSPNSLLRVRRYAFLSISVKTLAEPYLDESTALDSFSII